MHLLVRAVLLRAAGVDPAPPRRAGWWSMPSLIHHTASCERPQMAFVAKEDRLRSPVVDADGRGQPVLAEEAAEPHVDRGLLHRRSPRQASIKRECAAQIVSG